MMIGCKTLQRALVNWPRRLRATVTELKAKYLSSTDGARPEDEVIGISHDRLLRRREAGFRWFRVLRGRERAGANSLGDVVIDQKPWLVLRTRTVRWHADPFAPVVNPDDVEAWK